MFSLRVADDSPTGWPILGSACTGDVTSIMLCRISISFDFIHLARPKRFRALRHNANRQFMRSKNGGRGPCCETTTSSFGICGRAQAPEDWTETYHTASMLPTTGKGENPYAALVMDKVVAELTAF